MISYSSLQLELPYKVAVKEQGRGPWPPIALLRICKANYVTLMGLSWQLKSPHWDSYASTKLAGWKSHQ